MNEISLALPKETNSFSSIYSAEFQSQGPYDSMAEFAAQVGWSELYMATGLSYLTSQNIVGFYVPDIIGAACAGNYGQSPVTLVCACILCPRI